MSDSASLIASFIKRPTAASAAFLLLEQEPWAEGIGKVTRIDLIHALESQFFTGDGVAVDCGTYANGSGFTTLVYAYPSPADLAFETGITQGSVANPVQIVVRIREALAFSLETTKILSYPVQTFISAIWASEAWGVDGAVVDSPIIAVTGQEVSIEVPVYGTIYVEYDTVRYVYEIAVTAREDDIENIFQSVFYGWWNGGVKLLELDAPDNAESSYLSGTTCGGGNIIISPGDPEPPTVSAANKEISLDYCDDF